MFLDEDMYTACKKSDTAVMVVPDFFAVNLPIPSLSKVITIDCVQKMIRDLAAIVLYALGIDEPDFDEKGWTAQTPNEIFADAELPVY